MSNVPPPPPAPPPPSSDGPGWPTRTVEPGPAKKRRRWPWIVGGILALFILIGILNPQKSTKHTATNSDSSSDTTAVQPTTTTTSTTAPRPTLTGLPDPKLTPGEADPQVTQANLATTICRSGYSKSVRPGTGVTGPLKARVLHSYKLSYDPASFELDHLISLELGGAPGSEKNLWPEPWETKGARLVPKGRGAESKDKVENRLHDYVCAGRMQLADAQRFIATDWMSAPKSAPAVTTTTTTTEPTTTAPPTLPPAPVTTAPPPPTEPPTTTPPPPVTEPPTAPPAPAPQPEAPAPAPAPVPAPGGVRTGAVCNDGTPSSATGSGACSHHGGVNHWTYG